MESTKYIGRVGALAVALGIGSALTSGTGIAWADETGGNSAKTTSSSNEKPGTASGGTSANPGTRVKAPNRKGALSKIADRVRDDVEAGLDNLERGVKRTQSRLDSSRGALGDNATGTTRTRPSTRTGRSDFTRDADADPSPQATEADSSPQSTDTDPSPQAVKANRSPRPTNETGGAAPAVTRPQHTDTVVGKLTQAPADGVEPRHDVITPVLARVTAVETPAVAQRDRLEPATEAVTSAPAITAPTVVSALLSITGLSAFGAGTTPVAPAQSPALWAMMAWTRREFARSVNPLGTRVVSANDAASVVAGQEIQPMAAVSPTVAVQTDDLTPKPVVPPSLTDKTTKLDWVTGQGPTGHWYVAGTDLGIMWNSGYTDENGTPIIYTLFGDTYSGPGMTGDWRNNVLFRTSDTDMSDGLQFSDALIHAGAQPGVPGTPTWYGTGGPAAGAAQIIYDPGYDGLFGSTYTMIPTSAIAVENEDGSYTQYATVMSVRTWDNPGSWTTNYSGIAYSDDGGKTWQVDPDTVRASGWLRASASYVPGDEHFQQNALVMSDDPADPYVYVYGTPSGRQGSAYVARVEKDKITDLDAYEYFAGEDAAGAGQWLSGDPSAAVPVFGSSSTDFLPQLYKVLDTFTFGLFTKIANGIWVGGLPTNGNVSEMSVQYNEYLGKYVVLYTDGGNNVVMRVSDSPQGEWSDTTTLVANNLIGNTGMYAPMVHPMSGTDYFDTVDEDGNVVDNSQYLYYNLSYWGDYNVRLMQTDLISMKTISV